MPQLKMDGATPDSSADLCKQCANGMRISGEGFVRTFCNALDSPVAISGKVHECDRYHKKTATPGLYSMQQEAWYKTVLKDGRVTFCTQNGQRALDKMGLLFNEQEHNIKELLSRYSLEKKDEEIAEAVEHARGY